MRDRALQAAESMLDNVVSTTDAWAHADARWVRPLDARLAELETVLRTLEERLGTLQVSASPLFVCCEFFLTELPACATG